MDNTPPVVTTPVTETSKPTGAAPVRKKAPFPKIKMSNRTLVLGFVMLFILGSAYAYRNYFIAATVDGKPISRLAVIQELEKQGGESALDALITERLVAAEAAKAKIAVTPEEINQELDEIKAQVTAQGMTLEAALAQEGIAMEDLWKQIVTRKELEKLIGDAATVTDADIDAYLEETKIAMPQGMTEADFRAKVKTQIEGQKFGTEAERIIAEARKKANIKYLVDYGAPGAPEAAEAMPSAQ